MLLETLQHLFARVLPWRGCGFDWRGPGSEEEEGDSVTEAVGGLAISPEREQADFLALYHFVSDRVRSVRKDLTIQVCTTIRLLVMLEPQVWCLHHSCSHSW